MGNMIGPKCHTCPFGRECTCNEAPGKNRRKKRRSVKRGERNEWRRSMRFEGYRV